MIALDFYPSVACCALVSERKGGLVAQLGRGSRGVSALAVPVWFWVVALPAARGCLAVPSAHTGLKDLSLQVEGCRGAAEIWYHESKRDVAFSDPQGWCWLQEVLGPGPEQFCGCLTARG